MSSRSFESLVSSKDSTEDCLKNYDIVKLLGGRISPDVYLATCKRGRLKRRTVVLKKVIATEDVLGSVAVHQSLCHPTILTLFSTFPVVDSDYEADRQSQSQPQSGTSTIVMMRYIVLEYGGPLGTLSDHLPRLNLASPSPLEEGKVRGVVKSLADALTYLEKENVVHRNLVPGSIYVTEDFRVKLGGFDYAVEIPADDDNGRAGMPPPVPNTEVDVLQHHLAPEIKARLYYDCSSDLWSLGTLILWMLDPSRSSTSKLDSIRAEGELGVLVSQLMEKTPERRIKAWNISHHPFLDPRLPVQNLDPSPCARERQNEVIRPAVRKIHDFDRGNQEIAPPRKPFGDLTNPRRPLRDLRGDSRRASYQDCSRDVVFAAGPSTSIPPLVRAGQTNRRVVSDPVYGTKERRKFLDPIEEVENEPETEERPTPGVRIRLKSKSVAAIIPPFLQARGHTPTTGGSDSHNQVEDSSRESSVSNLEVLARGEIVEDMGDGMNTEELLRDFEEAFHDPPVSLILRQGASNEPTRRIKSILDTVVPESHSTPVAVRLNTIPRRISSPPPTNLPPSEPPCHPFDDPLSKGIGIPRPKPFNTSFLPPQTHKVARGQLVVLPSKTLLVDFREGERRQGRQGVEVLTISPSGEEIGVFSAPHMSTPCCLVEPSATYRLGDLPKTYWKLYAAAGKLVEQTKQHIPRLVLYGSDSKFILMTNFPEADIEAVFYSSEGYSGVQRSEGGELSGKKNGSFPLRGVAMRIKIVQSRQLVEISRQVLAPGRGRDCITKPSSQESPLREKEGEWKKVILVVPGGSVDAIDRTSLDEYERNGLERTEVFLTVCRAVESGLVDAGELPNGEISRISNSSSIPVCKTVDQYDNTIPRESKIIDLAQKLGRPQHSVAPTPSTPSVGWNKEPHVFPFEPSSLIQQPGGFETRFIPSVGWCVRYTGPSGGAGRYRMMFFDGKTLEVDVDEECVELMDSVRDEIVRYKIRECSAKRDVMEKMRAFKEFVSMFDDGSEAE